MAINMVKICAEVISRVIEFTLTLGLKMEFKNTFKFRSTASSAPA